MGMKDESDDDEMLYNRYITDESTLRQIDRTAEHQMELERAKAAMAPKTTSSGSGGSSSGKKKASSAGTKKTRVTKDKGPSGRVDSIDRPKNQYGTHSVKMKESLDESLVTESSVKYKEIKNIYYDLYNDVVSGEIKTDIHYRFTEELLLNKIKDIIDKKSIKAKHDATYEINKIDRNNAPVPMDIIELNEFYKEIEITLSNIFSDIRTSINKDNVKEIFDKNEYRLLYLLDFIQRKTYWYSYIKTGALLDKETAYVIFNSDEDKENHNIEIDTNKFDIDAVPSYHSFCNCKITFEKVVSK
jgi:hypothetical protein